MTTIRPRLRTSAFFAPSPDGLGTLLLNGDEVIRLQGTTTYDWLDRLAPHLNGDRTLGELTGGLPPAKREMVERLVTTLLDAGLARDVSRDAAHSLQPEELAAYTAEVTFIEAFCNSPASRFQQYRDSRALVIGAGSTVPALAHALLVSGIRRVMVEVTTEQPTDLAALATLRMAAAARDPHQRLTWRVPSASDHGEDGGAAVLEPMLGEVDLVVHIAEASTAARALALDGLCAAAGKVLVQAITVGDETWVGPVCGPDGTSVRWASLWHRIRTAGGDGGPAARRTGFLTGPVPGIIANHVVFGAFEYLTGVADRLASARAVRIDLETLETDVHPVPAHPLAHPVEAPTRAEFADRIRRLEGAGTLDHAALAARADEVSDDILGVFGAMTERHFVQFPLHVLQAYVHDPAPIGSPRELLAQGVAADFATARRRTAFRALELYASRMVDPRRLIGSDSSLYGLSLHDGAICQVPASHVFPVLSERQDPAPADPNVPATPSVGVAGAASWDMAVEAGLLAHCLDLTIESRTVESGPFPGVSMRESGLTRTSADYVEMLRSARQSYAVYDLTLLPRIVVLAFCMGRETISYHAGLTYAEAIERGLEQLLLTYQVRHTGQSEYAPAPVPQLPGQPDPANWAPTPLKAPTESAARRKRLVGALRTAGRRAVAVPLDHDPAVRHALPYLTRVVLVDADADA